MRIWELIGTVLDTIFRVVLMAAIIYVIIRGAQMSYDYGYRVFTEPPMSAVGGKDVTLTVPVDMSAVDLGKLFEDNGLSRDWKLFVLQYYGSEFREYVQGGTYTFNTTMTTEQMMEVMAQKGILAEQAEKEAKKLEAANPKPQANIVSEDKEAGQSEDGASENAQNEQQGTGDGIREINMSDELEKLLGNER